MSELTEAGGGCAVSFRHEGLSPQLECHELCHADWDQYLPGLGSYPETGIGNSFIMARLG